LIDEGGVMELWEEVSIVEVDLPETSSTLWAGSFWKLAFERRLSCLKKGMADVREERKERGENLFRNGAKIRDRLRRPASYPGEKRQ
jgi:hypothetical protein